MSTASEKAGAFLADNAPDADRVGTIRGETGDYARLRELIAKDDLSDDELEAFEALAEKRRTGTLEGTPRRKAYARRSVAGEREDESASRREKPKTASEIAARSLRGY